MADHTRRQLLRSGVQAATGLGLLALAGYGAYGSLTPSVAAPDDDSLLDSPLRIGYLPITDASALLAAHHRGLFAANGVPTAEPILFRSWDALAQALTTDQVDVVHLLLPMALQLRAGRGAPLKVIGWGHTNGSALTVRPGLEDLAELAGQTVAIPYWWSIHNVLLQLMLTDAGLTPITTGQPSIADGTVALTVMSPADMVPALGSLSIAGFVVADPFCAVAEAQHVGTVHRFLGDVWQDHACCAITVQESFTVQHPRAAAAVARSVIQAQHWLDGHRTQAGALLTDEGGFLPQPEAAVSRVFTREARDYAGILRHPDWHGQHLGFEAFPARSYTDELVRLMQQTRARGDTAFLQELAPGVSHRALVDESFAREALAGLGTAPTPRDHELIQP